MKGLPHGNAANPGRNVVSPVFPAGTATQNPAVHGPELPASYVPKAAARRRSGWSQHQDSPSLQVT